MISEEERQAAAFIAEYEALCRRHNMMVVMVDSLDESEDWEEDDEIEGVSYNPFAVARFEDDTVLDQVLEEMRLEPVRSIEQEEE